MAELGITEQIPEGSKHCTKCLKIKNIDEFGIRHKITGFFPRSWCKECEKIAKTVYDSEYRTRQCKHCKKNFQLKELTNTYYCVSCLDNEIPENCKKCTSCKYVKEKTEFGSRKAKNGTKRILSYCKICYKLVSNVKNRISNSIKNGQVYSSKQELIGCTLGFLRNWLEWQFDSKMSWENMGSYWHIDHVQPCSSFNFEDKIHSYIWTNLRPLEAKQNLQKGNKILSDQIMFQELKVKVYKFQIMAQRLNEYG